MTPQEFYTSQSFITDPKEYIYLYNELPRDIPALCRVVQGWCCTTSAINIW
ncbi:MAG: hypothetical protein U0694_15970 [Anaerolineae bacterium]